MIMIFRKKEKRLGDSKFLIYDLYDLIKRMWLYMKIKK